MSTTKRMPRLSFNAKVLIPVIAIIVLLVTFTLWTLNNRLTRQFLDDTAKNLKTAQRIFNNLEVMRGRHLLLRSEIIVNSPRFFATAQLAEENTIRRLLREMMDEINCDFMSYRARDGHVIAATARDPRIDIESVSDFGIAAAERALDGEPVPDMQRLDDSICRLAAVPVFVGNDIIGILTMAEKFSDASAEEFFKLTGCRVALFADDDTVLSTVMTGGGRIPDPIVAAAAAAGDVRTAEAEGNHVLVLGDDFKTMAAENRLHYVLVLGYEQTLRALHDVQMLLLGAGFLGILVSSGIIGLVIGRITNPLRALRKSAEAVARGDFSHKVDVMSSDELGELAEAFNRMVDNIQHSTKELQSTITTLTSTRMQLMQSEKLSALGEFIAGVTHELNNPLCTIVGFSELLKEQNAGASFHKDLDIIADAANRCHRIVQNLLSFARQRAPERKPTAINEIIDSTINFMSYELRTSNVSVRRDFDRNLPAIVADAHQLQQVFLNLINNARQAIVAAREKGNIIVATVVDNKTAVIRVSDDGPGIPPENLGRIFDPFFTTKEVGKGTGLGLSVSYGIIREHGGEISVQSRVGEGTTFEIRLPVPETPWTDEGGATEKSRPVSKPLLGEGRRVLVLDDEPDVLKLISKVLEADHFDVATSTEGTDALRKIRQGWFDIILCDWRMPGMTGRAFFEELRSLHPAAATRLVFMTGDVLNDQTTTYLKDSGKICINKPFSLEEFRLVVKEVIA